MGIYHLCARKVSAKSRAEAGKIAVRGTPSVLWWWSAE